MTLVILCRQIDISIGSQFSICGVVAGLLAQAGLPMPLVGLGTLAGRGGAGGGQRRARRRAGAAVDRGDAGHAGDPPRVAPLRPRGGVRPRPARPASSGSALGQAAGPVGGRRRSRWRSSSAFAWALRHLAAGRAVYATGSDPEAARLAGIRPRRVVFGVFVAMGALAGLAALLNAVRFADVDPNAGDGPGAPGDRRGGRRRRGGLGRAGDARRHPDRRAPARLDRPGPGLPRTSSRSGRRRSRG